MNTTPDSLKVLEAQMDQLSADMILVLSRSSQGNSDEKIAKWGAPWKLGPRNIKQAWAGICGIFGLDDFDMSEADKRNKAREIFISYAKRRFPGWMDQKIGTYKKRRVGKISGLPV